MPSRAQPVLLLHGQPGGARDWGSVSAALGPSAEVIAVDRPGWDGRRPATGLAGNAAAALALLDARGIDRAKIAGHSFGGAVAAWLAADHPKRVSSLVLVAPSANLASLYRLDRWLASRPGGDLASAVALSAVGLALAAAPLRRRVSDRLALDERYVRAAGTRLMTPNAWRAFVTEQRALVRELPSLERRLGKVSAPTKILVGSADWVVRPSSARRLTTQIPHAELQLVSRAGHLLPQAHPERVASLIAAG